MKHIPQALWLNIGDQADDKDANDFRELDHELITWSENKVSSGDVKYIREKIVKVLEKGIEEDMQFLLNLIDKFVSVYQNSEMNLVSEEENIELVAKTKQIAKRRNLNF